MEKYILQMEHITKTFPGVKALDDVTFQVKKGEIHALVGGKRSWKIYSDEGPERYLYGQHIYRKNNF